MEMNCSALVFSCLTNMNKWCACVCVCVCVCVCACACVRAMVYNVSFVDVLYDVHKAPFLSWFVSLECVLLQ